MDPQIKRESPIEELEQRLQRRVGIRTDEIHVLDRCLHQGQSPLFALLPRELRDLIWEYATAPYEDNSRVFEETAYYYRPGHTASLKTDTALLRTCRRMWLESHAMPMLQAEHSFYYHRPAPDRRDQKWMASLTDRNRQNFGQLHLFVQMYAIETLSSKPGKLRSYFLETPYASEDFQPRMLRVTLRHTDWWYWEDDEPLRLDYRWVEALLNSPDLRSTETLILELETLEYKKDQLDPIVDRLKSLVSREVETHVVDDKPAKTTFRLMDKSDIYTWEGPPNIDGQIFDPYDGLDRLKYHVETLTWKLNFVDFPKGYIPRLRRLPRTDPYGLQPRKDNDLQGFYAAVKTKRRHPPWRLPSHRYYKCSVRMWKQLVVYERIQEITRKQAESTESIRRKQFKSSIGYPGAEKAKIAGPRKRPRHHTEILSRVRFVISSIVNGLELCQPDRHHALDSNVRDTTSTPRRHWIKPPIAVSSPATAIIASTNIMMSSPSPQRFVYSPLPTSSPGLEAALPAGQVVLYCVLTLGLLLLATFVCTLLRRLQIRRLRARSREDRKAAMIAAAAAKHEDWRIRAGMSEESNQSAQGTAICCYRRGGEVEDVEKSRSLPPLPSLKRSCRGRPKRESAAGIRLVENVFEDPPETVDDESVAGEMEGGEEHDGALRIDGDHTEFDHGTSHQTPQRYISLKLPAACITTPAREEDVESSSPPRVAVSSTPNNSISRTLTKSDDMFQRRNKAKSLELLHLKGRLAYPPAVHSPSTRFEKIQLPQVKGRVERCFVEDRKLNGRTAMKMLVDAVEGRECSWQTLGDDTGEFRNLQDTSWMVGDREDGSVEASIGQHRAGEQDEWQEARLVVNRPMSQISLVGPQSSALEEDWEDISEVSTLATRSSDESMRALPTHTREM